MDSLIHKINLDCLRKDSQAIVNAKIGEASGRKIVFTLYEGRAPFFVPSDTTVVFRAKKPSGAVLYNNCVVDDGKIEYTITSQTVAEKGVFPCEIQIIGADNKVIYTPCITLNVAENLYSDTEVESSNEFTELENALNKIPSLEVINSKYTKPESGIPKSDLAQDVQNSLNKANTALQEHQSLAAYRTAEAQDLIDSTKQDKLIAGENITITENGTISSTSGGAKAFFLNVFVITETEVVTNKTYAEIKAAIDAGDIIYITDKNGIVYVPQVGTTNTKIELLWIESQYNRTLYWTAVVDSENAWSAAEFELVDIDKLSFELNYINEHKVDKATGKGLSTNDYTYADKAKVDAIPANPKYTDTVYDDTVVKKDVSFLYDTKQDKLIAGENITIAADGKTISATGGGISVEDDGAGNVEITEFPSGGGGSRSIAMRVDSGYIQYSTDNGNTWVNLISEANLKGDTGATGAAGKSAYQYAQEGGYTGTEAKFNEKLAQEPLIGTTSQLTPTQVYNAVSAGIPVKVQYTDSTYGVLYFTAFNIAESFAIIVSQTIVYANGGYILAELIGNKSNNIWSAMFTTLAQKTDIPSSLKNPNALTIKIGSTTVTYDGSTAQTVTIDDGTEVEY